MQVQNRPRYFRIIRLGQNGVGEQAALLRKDSLELRSEDSNASGDVELQEIVDVFKSAKSSQLAALPIRLGEILTDFAEYYATCQDEVARRVVHDLILDAYKTLRKLDAKAARVPDSTQ